MLSKICVFLLFLGVAVHVKSQEEDEVVLDDELDDMDLSQGQDNYKTMPRGTWKHLSACMRNKVKKCGKACGVKPPPKDCKKMYNSVNHNYIRCLGKKMMEKTGKDKCVLPYRLHPMMNMYNKHGPEEPVAKPEPEPAAMMVKKMGSGERKGSGEKKKGKGGSKEKKDGSYEDDYDKGNEIIGGRGMSSSNDSEKMGMMMMMGMYDPSMYCSMECNRMAFKVCAIGCDMGGYNDKLDMADMMCDAKEKIANGKAECCMFTEYVKEMMTRSIKTEMCMRELKMEFMMEMGKQGNSTEAPSAMVFRRKRSIFTGIPGNSDSGPSADEEALARARAVAATTSIFSGQKK